MPIQKTADSEDSRFMFDLLPDSENGRFGRFGRPAEPSAPTGGRFGRLWGDSRFHLQSSAATVIKKRGEFACAAMVIESVQSLLPSTGLVFARMNLKPTVLKNFVFDLAMYFRLCEIYHLQNLVGLELPIKHALNNASEFWLICTFIYRFIIIFHCMCCNPSLCI